jgi:RNA polymerase-binding transcription factor DksA
LQKSALWIELTRQRALLLVSSNASLTADGEPDVCSDLADQASTEIEQDLAMQVRTWTFDKLRRIEHALDLMRTNGYGQCRRCREDIPHDRLTVQPDAGFCVPCLTFVEQNAARH